MGLYEIYGNHNLQKPEKFFCVNFNTMMNLDSNCSWFIVR